MGEIAQRISAYDEVMNASAVSGASIVFGNAEQVEALGPGWTVCGALAGIACAGLSMNLYCQLYSSNR